MKCKDIQKRLKAFISDDMDEKRRNEIQKHLDSCLNCSRYLQQLTKLSEVVQTWKGMEPYPHLWEKVKSRIKEDESLWGRIFTYAFLKKAALSFAGLTTIVVLTLFVSNLIQKPAQKVSDDLTTINFYLTEHQEVVAQEVSAELAPQPPTRIYVDRENILYYEFIEDFPRFARPGIIVRGLTSQREISPQKTPVISKGKILSFPQAQQAVDFNPVAPPSLHPGYILDSIKKINDYNSLHLIYTNGIDTLSLFEQSLNGERGLVAKDFREYAIYRSIEPTAGLERESRATILAWSNGSLSFVLVAKMSMSQLTDMAQFISAAKRKDSVSNE
ncbi:MAG: zf-HC2 domain-containing protein [Candidatus Aminicenantes bacterium]|nr:MAG: zf-HC2 domain-containing protein [Candidatus Aminicenantes bacterium]